jgi:hypothetical protein
VLSALSTKRTESIGQDYNVLLYTALPGTWGAAAGCVCREHLGEKKPLLPYYSHFRKHMKKNSLKWQKILLKIQKLTKKLPQNWKNDLKLKNNQKVIYKTCISVTSSSSLGFIYLRALHRIQGKKDVKIQAHVITHFDKTLWTLTYVLWSVTHNLIHQCTR